jgi:hypothetical protein
MPSPWFPLGWLQRRDGTLVATPFATYAPYSAWDRSLGARVYYF